MRWFRKAGNSSPGVSQSEELTIAVLTFVMGIAIIGFGIAGYMVFAGWSFGDALYQTAITISTVGFNEVRPLTPAGRIVTLLLIAFSFTLLGYFFSKFVTLMVEGRINTLLRGRKMEKSIARLNDHFIICGFGKMGIQVAFEFMQANVPFVVMDSDPESFNRQGFEGLLWITGDATREEDLDRCGIARARGLVSVLSEDRDNIYVVLTARGLNTNIRIITRAQEYESEKKLRRAGADYIVSPFKIGGSRIASMMLRPSITHFLDGFARAEEIRLTLVEVEVDEDSHIKGQAIGESGIADLPDTVVVALRRPEIPMRIDPPRETVLAPGDQIILMGRLDAINKLETMIKKLE